MIGSSMKTFVLLIAVLLWCSAGVHAQLKSELDDQPSASQSLVHPAPTIGNLLGFFNPENFSMQNSLSYSYISAGGTGLSVASYTNSMFYKIFDPLNVRVDLTLQGTPLGASTPYQSALNGLFLSRAELNYKPSQNFSIKVQYNHLPVNYYGMYNPWYGMSPFSSNWGDQ